MVKQLGRKSYKKSTSKVKKSTSKAKKYTSKSKNRVKNKDEKIIIIRFSVSIRNDIHNIESKDHVAKVLHWYKKQISFYKNYNKNVKSLSVEHLRNNLFQINCIYTNDDPSTVRSELLSMVIDPDHDGNDHLLINGSSYLVRGKQN